MPEYQATPGRAPMACTCRPKPMRCSASQVARTHRISTQTGVGTPRRLEREMALKIAAYSLVTR